MPDVKVYIRTENIDKWNAIANKAEWLNTLLKNSGDTSQYGATRDVAGIEMVTVLSEELEPEEENEDPYPGYAIHRATGQVVDTLNEKEVDEVTPEMVKYLKKENRYV